MNISQILRGRRIELQISQAALAKYIGFKHKSSIHYLEVGKVEWKFNNVVTACKMLKLKIQIIQE